MNSMNNSRAVAATALAGLLGQQGSLTTALDAVDLPERERAWVQALCFETLRQYPRLAGLLKPLLDKPLKARDQDIQALLLIGLCQLAYMRIPAHAAINETVQACSALHKGWAKGLINAVLRAYQRQAAELEKTLSPAARLAHPEWLWQRIRRQWPTEADAILAANNSHPPLCLRVNRRHGSRSAYLERLQAAGMAALPCQYAPDGLWLAQPVPVQELPGWATGDVSVQDESAQLAATLLPLKPGLRLLDACAAPGGKTCHLLEIEPTLQLTALDIDARRLQRVQQNLDRLGLSASLCAGDLGLPAEWWEGEAFDAILLDAPCSGTGVIRRHPDIKLLRQPGSMAALVDDQALLLRTAWSLLAPGGVLLYATCSILPEENAGQIRAFLADTPGARDEPLPAAWGHDGQPGRQILPHPDGGDGFYYARLHKTG